MFVYETMVQFYVLVTIHFKIYSRDNLWSNSFKTEGVFKEDTTESCSVEY